MGFSICIINAGIIKLSFSKAIFEFPFSVHEQALTPEKIHYIRSLQHLLMCARDSAEVLLCEHTENTLFALVTEAELLFEHP